MATERMNKIHKNLIQIEENAEKNIDESEDIENISQEKQTSKFSIPKLRIPA
jgi:hypothetical protein